MAGLLQAEGGCVMERIESTQRLSSYLTKENVQDSEALRVIEVTALARIADALRDMNEQPLRML